MATIRNIVIEKNTAFSMSINVNDITNIDMNLSAYTFKAQLRRSFFSSTAVDFAIDSSGNATGDLVLSLTTQQCQLLRPGRYVYDVVGINANNEAIPGRILEGIAVVNPGATYIQPITSTTTTTTIALTTTTTTIP